MNKTEYVNQIYNRRHLYTLIVLLYICNFSIGQVKFDVKTTLEEKKQLHIVKLAVINALQESNWATVKEIGEDYSIWLTNLKRLSSSDSITTELDFDLRTPAMFTRGKHISTKHVLISFDTTGISNAKTPDDSLVYDLLVQGLDNSGALSEFTKLFVNSIPFGNILVTSFISKALKELNRQPTPFETLEANMIAAKTVVELRELIFELSNKK